MAMWPCGLSHPRSGEVQTAGFLKGQVAFFCVGRNVPHCFQRDPQVKVSKSRLFSQFELAELAELPQNCRSHGWFASIRLELPHRGCQRGVSQSEMSAGHVISGKRDCAVVVVGIRMDVFHSLVNTLIQPLPLTLETQVDAWCLFSLQTEQMHTEKLCV